MPQSIANAHNILRALNSGGKVRAIIVLVFAVIIGVMLLTFPGPLFKKVTKPLHYRSEWTTQTLPDANAQTIELRQRAAAALALLKAKSVRASNER
jgi:uncharacterized membrane protein YedE/YeeE